MTGNGSLPSLEVMDKFRLWRLITVDERFSRSPRAGHAAAAEVPQTFNVSSHQHSTHAPANSSHQRLWHNLLQPLDAFSLTSFFHRSICCWL